MSENGGAPSRWDTYRMMTAGVTTLIGLAVAAMWNDGRQNTTALAEIRGQLATVSGVAIQMGALDARVREGEHTLATLSGVADGLKEVDRRLSEYIRSIDTRSIENEKRLASLEEARKNGDNRQTQLDRQFDNLQSALRDMLRQQRIDLDQHGPPGR